MKQPLVSIITVVFNREKTIEKALKSVVNQTYNNIEYIVIDGGSTDRTVEIIKKYSDDIDFFESKKDDGMYYALNRGIEVANGDLIGICHSDDYFYNNHVIRDMVEVHNEQKADIYFGSVFNLRNDTLSEELVPTLELEKTHTKLYHPATFICKTVYNRYGNFNTKYRSASDYELMLRFKVQNCNFYRLEFPVCIMTVGTDNRVSHNCYSHKEAFKIHKTHKTGNHLKYLYSYNYCRMVKLIKKILKHD